MAKNSLPTSKCVACGMRHLPQISPCRASKFSRFHKQHNSKSMQEVHKMIDNLLSVLADAFDLHGSHNQGESDGQAAAGSSSSTSQPTVDTNTACKEGIDKEDAVKEKK